MDFTLCALLVGEVRRHVSEIGLIPFVLTLNQESALLQKHAIHKIVRPRFLHLHVNTEPVRGFRADVEPERLDHGEDDVNFRILDDYGFNLVAVILEYPIQEAFESQLVAQKRLESCVKKRIEVLVFLDFFDGFMSKEQIVKVFKPDAADFT